MILGSDSNVQIHPEGTKPFRKATCLQRIIVKGDLRVANMDSNTTGVWTWMKGNRRTVIDYFLIPRNDECTNVRRLKLMMKARRRKIIPTTVD